MKEFTDKIETAAEIYATLTLPFDLRQKSRQRVQLDNGEEASLLLKRGPTLQNGDLLAAEDGTAIKVVAADEQLSSVVCEDVLLFARACYHLGNRHTPLQIVKERLSYLHDHVLDDMLAGLGLQVNIISAPFEPESGAYGGHTSDSAEGHSHHHHAH